METVSFVLRNFSLTSAGYSYRLRATIGRHYGETWKLSYVNRRVSTEQEEKSRGAVQFLGRFHLFWTSQPPWQPGPAALFFEQPLRPSFISTLSFRLPLSLSLAKIVVPLATTRGILAVPGELKDLLNHRSSVSRPSSFDRPVRSVFHPCATSFRFVFPLRHGDYARGVNNYEPRLEFRARLFSPMVFGRANSRTLRSSPRRGLFGYRGRVLSIGRPTIRFRFCRL